MAKSTEMNPELTYEDVRDEYSKFEARVSPTNVEGVHNLKLVATRPFRNSQELAEWLRSGVIRLESDLSDKGM